jgi:hypothetical protein
MRTFNRSKIGLVIEAQVEFLTTPLTDRLLWLNNTLTGTVPDAPPTSPPAS